MLLLTIARREFFQLVHSMHGLGPLFLSLAGSGSLLLWFLQQSEGTSATLPALWGLAAAIGLPFLAAVAASRGFTQDRERGMLRLMFATPVRSRSWVLGKVWAAWGLCMIFLFGLAVACWVMVHWLMPLNVQLPMTGFGFWLAAAALAIEAFFWCSLGTLVSLFSRSSASTFLASLLGCLLVPPAVCRIGLWLTPGAAVQWPWFPYQALVYDCAGGLVDIRMLAGCVLVSVWLIYTAGLTFDALRLCATER